jgi:Carboxypeptidase regulatory-like domain
MRRFSIAFLLVIFSSGFVFAQTTVGRLSGTVLDGAGNAVPGATVTAKDNATSKETTTTTNESGDYSLTSLEFGTYSITATANGFKTFVANAVKIDVGRDYKLDPKLEAGKIDETVTVTGGEAVVTSDTAQVSTSISPQQILSLPLITRNPLTLAGLQAGVSANSAQLTTINGMRTTMTNITRDGINIQDQFIRSNATDFAPGRPSVDDTGEFTIATANQEADQGYGGAQIRLVTPRGTKDFHGALFAYNRNSAFAANSFFNNRSTNPAVSEKPSFRNRNQYGGKASGPLWVPGFNEGGPMLYKDKAFFFFAYEGIKDPVSAAATRTILTPSARNGAFTYTRTNNTDVTPFCPSQTIGTLCTIPNILTYAQGTLGQGNPATPIPGTVPAIIANRILSQLPTASNFTGGDGLNTAGYRLIRRSDQTRDQVASRVDVDLNDKNSFNIIYAWNEELNLRPDADTTKFTTVPGVSQTSVNRQFTVAYRRVFTSNFINETRVGFFGSEVPFFRTGTDEVLPSYLLTPVPLVTTPENTFLNQGRNTKGYTISNNSDWILGDHTLRFGALAQIYRVNSYNDAGIVPTVTVSTGTNTPTFVAANFPGGINTTQVGTANGLLGLLGGFYTNVVQFFNIAEVSRGFERLVTRYQPFRYENHALYISDRWSARRELTFTLGVRYELFPALRLNNGIALEPVISDPDNPIASLLDPNGTYDVIGGNAGRKNAYYKTDYNNFAPNLGVAWSPSFENGFMGFLFGQNKTVIRGGYSHIYGNDSIVTSINNAANNNSGFGTSGLQFSNLNGRLGAGDPPVVPLATLEPLPRSYLRNNAPGIGTFLGVVYGIDPKIQIPKIEQYSVGIQREIPGGMAFEVRYVGTRSDNLARGVDLGQIDIVNNGFLADFLRAKSNFALTGNMFCAVAGCQPLTIFQNGGAAAPGKLVVGTGGLALTTVTGNLTNGTPADLAISYINSAANLNNQPCFVPGGSAVCGPTSIPRIKFLPNPATGIIDYFVNDGWYQYNSLQMELRKRFSNGFTFQANYTFAKNLTNAVGTSQALLDPYLDNARPELDVQRADYDQTHTFNFFAIYQLPFGKGKMFLNNGGLLDKLVGGWEVSGLGQWTSGAPITFVDTRGTYNRTARSGRQTAASNLDNAGIRGLMGTFEANGNIYWINPSVINANGQASAGYGSTAFTGQSFFNIEPGSFGGVGRTIVNGPRYFNINMAVLKNVRFTETMRLQLRMEAFNALNNTNFVQNTQFANINSTAFGQITTAFGPREIQFAARFEF